MPTFVPLALLLSKGNGSEISIFGTGRFAGWRWGMDGYNLRLLSETTGIVFP